MGGKHQDVVELLLDFGVRAELVLGALTRWGQGAGRWGQPCWGRWAVGGWGKGQHRTVG